MGKRGKKKVKQAWLDNMTSNTSDMVDQFEDSTSASGSTELKFRRDAQSQSFDICPDFDDEIVVAALSYTPQKPAAEKSKRVEFNLSGNINVDVLAAISELTLKHKTF